MRGAKPKPTALKVLHGSDRPCRVNKDEPKPKADKIRMPHGLTTEAKRHWPAFAKMLTEAGVLTNMDVTALAMMCEVYARWLHANDQLQNFGIVVKSPGGFPIQSPFLMVAHKSFEQLQKLLVEFGMTPSSRTRVTTAQPEDNNKSDLASYLKQSQRR